MAWMMPDATPTDRPSTRHVFVYGTLRKGGCNDIARFVPAPTPVGHASIAGQLYDLGPYPGAVLGGEGRLVGEIYGISAAVEAALDTLEEVRPDDSGEYAKRNVQVALDGRAIRCLVYEINPARIVGAPRIDSGDWLAYLNSTR